MDYIRVQKNKCWNAVNIVLSPLIPNWLTSCYIFYIFKEFSKILKQNTPQAPVQHNCKFTTFDKVPLL